MAKELFRVEQPLIIMFEEGAGSIKCHLYPSKSSKSHREYGMLICDLVRHVARAFDVAEEEVWEFVDKERDRPTTSITELS
jgi:hypothetical protein